MDIAVLIAEGEAAERREEIAATVPLRDQDGAPMELDGAPITISVVGRRSKTAKAADAQQTRDFYRAQRHERDDADWLLAQRAKYLACVIRGWSGFTANGTIAQPTATNIASLLRWAPWFDTRVTEAMVDAAHWPMEDGAPDGR